MSIVFSLSQFFSNVQYRLFPDLEKYLGHLTSKHKKIITILELIKVENFIAPGSTCPGRPQKGRAELARAFVTKSVLNLKFTNQLVEQLKGDGTLREICGWKNASEVPSEATFSRAFKDFADTEFPQKVHEALIKGALENELVFHVVRDSTPLRARERKNKTIQKPTLRKSHRLRRKGAVPEEKLSRLEKQALGRMSVEEMISDLPKTCDVSGKKGPGGLFNFWKGYKLHAAIADGCIPLAAIITSASVNDSQVAIPLGIKAAQVATNLYDLMDSAYDHEEIKDHSKSLGHVPIVDIGARSSTAKQEKKAEAKGRATLNVEYADQRRYKERCKAERFNALLQENYGGNTISVKGHSKVSCHVMFGILALSASLLLNLV